MPTDINIGAILVLPAGSAWIDERLAVSHSTCHPDSRSVGGVGVGAVHDALGKDQKLALLHRQVYQALLVDLEGEHDLTSHP